MKPLFKQSVALLTAIGFLLPSSALAITAELEEVYAKRPDLQQAFSGAHYQAVEGSAAGFLIDLEDWARQYGWRDYPEELALYKPEVTPVTPRAFEPPPEVTSVNYIVIDDASGEILAVKNAEAAWPIASITKLVTTKIALDNGLDPYVVGAVENIDNVGGARLWVDGGTRFLVKDLLYATLVGSANNAANAVARLTGFNKTDFVEKMNAFAASKNLSRTRFADPSGIEVENTSTAREVAFIARETFQNPVIRRMAGTWRMHIEALNDEEYKRSINSTNWMLYDPAYDDVYVTAGKTGFLYESKWNLVVRMHPMGEGEDKSVLIVVLGADDRRSSFDDAHALAKWAWTNYNWDRE